MEKKKERIFSIDVEINKFKLEEECEKHPGMYFYWADRLADAKSKLNEQEDKLKLIMAECELRMRKTWNETKFGKMTEAGVKCVVEKDLEVKNMKDNVNSAQREVNTLIAAVAAMEHRKASLDNLVTMLVRGFYSAPNGGRRTGMNEEYSNEVRKNLRGDKEKGDKA